nr:reverse transcriptase domain-containing protein [Tanacetum cinerariifolium]
MKEVHYHSWLSNPAMVKKHDDSWRMCVDFKDLNKACPKDGYPLPKIDWKVESLSGYPYKCFLDAYKGHHQIKMAKEDEEKTAFITSQGIFCYSKMSFGLKNAGATYQRLVDKAFQKHIGRNLEAYTIVVIMDQPIKQLLSNPEVTGRLLKWRFELGEHDIQYRPRTSVKGQILADFIVKRPEYDTPDTSMEDKEELPDPWILFTDGSSCIDGSGAGLIIMNPKGMEFTYALREKSIDEKEILAVVEEERHTWMTPVYEYLTKEILPKEKKKSRVVRCKARRYAVINEVLYKKSSLAHGCGVLDPPGKLCPKRNP